MSLVFSTTKTVALHGRRSAVWRILYRSAILYLFGLILYHGFDQPIHAFPGMTEDVHAIRWFGVLQRIAIVYGLTGLLFVWLQPRWLLVSLVVILIGYWLALTYIPVPGHGTHSYAEGRNLANYLDQHYLGGWKWDGDHDPEGYLSNIPAVATCLLGLFAGLLLQKQSIRPYAKVMILIFGGAALAAAGYAWGFLPSPVQFPVIKKIWTSSYVLLAGGYSAMIFGVFYMIIDVWRLRAWSTPFVWIGANAITIYMLGGAGLHSNREPAARRRRRAFDSDVRLGPINDHAERGVAAHVHGGAVSLCAQDLHSSLTPRRNPRRGRFCESAGHNCARATPRSCSFGHRRPAIDRARRVSSSS